MRLLSSEVRAAGSRRQAAGGRQQAAPRFLATGRWPVTLLRLLVAVLFLLPPLWMVLAALHAPGTPLPTTFRLLPQSPTLENFGRVWSLVPMAGYALNSALVVMLAVPLTLVTASWAGFAMAGLPRASQRRWVVISLAVLMVPGIALWSTRFLVFRSLGWLDTHWALIAPAWMGTSPFYVLMFYRAFRRIPAALYDAARLDGAGVLGAWWYVGMPIARATALGVAVLSFVVYWGDFISPLLYLSEDADYTLPVALRLLQQLARSDWPLLMAAAVLATAVPVVLFVVVQPYFSRVGEEEKE